jgi:hypothetical protein
MALDGSKEPAVLWVGSAMSSTWSRFGLLRIEDRGSAFGELADIAKRPENSRPTARRATDLALAGNRLYVWPQRGDAAPAVFDARGGEAVKDPPVPPKRFDRAVGFIFAAGRDGNTYLFSGYPTTSLARFDAALKPFPFPAAKNGEIPDLGSPRTRLRGMCADVRGNVYVLRQRTDIPTKGLEDPHSDANAVAMFGPDGKTINDKLVDSDLRNLNSVCADPAGNIYLAVGVHPGAEALPPNLKGKLPDGRKDPDAELGHNYYPLMYGSIVKFGPAGGEIRLKGEGEPANFAYGKKLSVKGAKWMFSGASLVPAWVHYASFKPNICQCESPRFDVDGFGRSFFGDACGFRVGVLDTGGNLICWFGSYGNQDSAGPGSPIPTPEIPIGWAHAVAVDDEAAFVGDRLNQRVVRVKLGCAAEASCALP